MSKKSDEMADKILDSWGQPNPEQQLPSRFQLGDVVNLNFYRCGNLYGCRVVKVHFAAGKVLYDFELPVTSEPSTPESDKAVNWTRIHNIDSAYVEPSQSTK